MNMTTNTILKTIFIGITLTMINGFALASERWVACGDDQLRFYEIQGDSAKETERLSWSDLTISASFSDVKGLNGIVECKPVSNGEELLVTSWLGGVARVNIADRTVNFSANVSHAHSAELLPNNRLVFVGNVLKVFDADNGATPLIQFRLDDGHGVSWDPNKKILYVLSEDVIEEYELQEWDTSVPKLKSVRKTQLPGQSDGHDLSAANDGSLLISTRDGVWRFEPDDRRFTALPNLNPLHRAQSVVQTDTHLVWVQAEQSWWGRGFFVKVNGSPAQRVDTADVRMYKVRNIP